MNHSLARTRIGIAGLLVVALVAGLLVWMATRSDGEIVRKAELHDGGVWVTSTEQARYGRMNKAAAQLDLGVASEGAAGTGLDVFQDGAAVLGYSAASNRVVPIDPATATRSDDNGLVLPKLSAATGNQVFSAPPIDLRGGTVALVEPTTGALRAGRVDERTGITNLDTLQSTVKPLATVGANAAVAVAEDGSVFAVSAATGTLAVLRPNPTGTAAGSAFQPAQTVKLGFTGKSAQVTAVGTRWVVLDDAKGTIYAQDLTTPATTSLGSVGEGLPRVVALQQPGPDAATVAVQDRSKLEQVTIAADPGTAASAPKAGIIRAQGAQNENVILAAPVRVGDCVHAAWTGPKDVYYGRSCASGQVTDQQDTQTVLIGSLKKGVREAGAKLRVNRATIVLNDLDSGDVWDVDNKQLKIDNWASLVPPPKSDDKNTQKDQNLVDDDLNRTPPKAMPDAMKVRPGRTSTLHVLDNDTDATGAILAIAPDKVTQPDLKGVATSASADGQTVQVTVPSEPGASSFSFTYQVNNGTAKADAKESTAKVTVQIVDDAANTPPRVRDGLANLAASEYPALVGSTTRVGVIADWRDPENDPLTIEGADSSVTVDGAGALMVGGREKAGKQVVGYAVLDGRGGRTPGSLTLKVLSDTDKPIPPRAQADVVRAVVGKPVQLMPLGNDIPGADPSDPEASLRLAGEVQGPGQLSIDTNTDTGVVTVTGVTPGTSTVTYAAQSGGGAAAGRIRVDILPDPGSDRPPVATPDTATLLGQTPVIADVLSNDTSPRSDVLVVQRVEAGSGWLRASIVQGRWVRIQAISPANAIERTGTLSYTISDGTKSATGQILVTQKPIPRDRILPTVVDDVATVRVGDAVTVPVLDNDSMAGGVPLKLDPAAVKAVLGGGQAFASGSVLRYIPDPAATAKGPATAVIEYTAFPEGMRSSARTGRVTVTINPLPSTTLPNRAPTARSFSASVTAGDRLTITVPTSGVDPDGDLAFVGGIVGEQGGAIALERGRVLGFGAASIRYEAYPRSSGTEVIRYVLRDRFGGESQGFIRVGVVQPGDPQPPVAVQDDVVAAPGRTVTYDVLANDLISPDDRIELESLSSLNDPAELKEFTQNKDNTFSTLVPAEGPAKVLTYGITNGLFDPSRSTLTVRGQEGFNNAPIAVDDVGQAKPGETSILVDALANDRDIDGKPTDLRIARLIGDGATLEGGKVRITLQKQARVIPYVLEDADKATAMALIYVPAGDNGLPFTVIGKTIKMDANSTVDVNLGDYVSDPAGGQVTITSPETLSTTPKADLQGAVPGSRALTLTSLNGYVGPAAVMVEVEGSVPLTTNTGTDAAQPAPGATEPAAGAGSAASTPSSVRTTPATTYVTIPVQIGPDVPVLRCPAYEITLAADGPARSFDIPRLCRAWLPDSLASGEYEAVWSAQPGDVSLTSNPNGRVVVQAGAGAKAGSTGTIDIRAKGGTETFPVKVRVTSQPPLPTLRPIAVEGLLAGTSRTVNVAQYLDSPLSAPQCAITASRVVSGTGLSVSQQGCRLTVTASEAARFTGVLAIQVADHPDRAAVDGQVSVSVRGKPDPMATPTAVADRIQGSTARVTFAPPPYDGGLPILQYEVRINGGGTQVCPGSPCTVTGLENGKPYRFEVRSRNSVDWSAWSGASAPVTPDTKPQATNVAALTPGDRAMTVAWTAPVNEGSAVLEYQLQWTNIGANAGAGGTKKIPASTMTTLVSGLVNNDQYTYRVQARNGAGWGPYGPTMKGQSFGVPGTVPAPKLAPRTPTPDANNAQVTVTWPAVDPNGPAITTYEVFRRSGGAWNQIATVSGGAQRVAIDSIPYQGQQVQYTVTATNGGGKTSARTNFSTYKADGIPVAPRLTSVSTPNADQAANAAFTLGNSRSTGYTRVNWRTSTGASGSWTCSGGCSGGQASGLSAQEQSMQLQAVNAAGKASPWSNSVSFTPYGPTQGVGGIGSSHTDHEITFSWNQPAYNGNPIGGYRISWSGASSGSETLGAGTTSKTIGGLDYTQTVSITVTPFADRSGDGPTSGGSDTTNDRPPMKVTFGSGAACGQNDCWVPASGGTAGHWCWGTNCYHVRYIVEGAVGGVHCTFIEPDPPYVWGPEDRAGNGTWSSSKFSGNAGRELGVSCTDTLGRNARDTSIWPNPRL